MGVTFSYEKLSVSTLGCLGSRCSTYLTNVGRTQRSKQLTAYWGVPVYLEVTLWLEMLELTRDAALMLARSNLTF